MENEMIEKNVKERTDIKISQCMIVKNEEANIRQALSWGKEIMAEQIVVDTGSTDQTAEIAAEMGAKVYQFDWNDNFSQAKNYAIDKASGEWIVFLDADEYIKPVEVIRLKEIIEEMSAAEAEGGKTCHVIRTKLANLDDAGQVFSVFMQDRVFRNVPFLRYEGEIHENLAARTGEALYCYNAVEKITIFHTGYQESVFSAKGKANRNIQILKAQLEKEPKNYSLMSYLGDSLDAAKNWEEAARYDQQVVDNRDKGVRIDRLTASFYRLMRNLAVQMEEEAGRKLQDLYWEATECIPDYPDFDYIIGLWMMKHNRWRECALYMERSLAKAAQYKGSYTTRVESNYTAVCYWIGYGAYLDQMMNKALKYLVPALRSDKRHDASLRLLLKIFHENGTPFGEVLDFLMKIYDKETLTDKLYLIKEAKAEGWPELEQAVRELLTEEDKETLRRLDDEAELSELPWPFISHNRVDELFALLMRQLCTFSQKRLLNIMKNALEKLKKENRESYSVLLRYYNGKPSLHDGRGLSPETENYGVLEQRAQFLHGQRERIFWAYHQLGDYRSKKTLLAILSSFLYLNRNLLSEVSEGGASYFDPDIIKTGQDDVFVDVGAYTGDTLYSYIQCYGKEYKKIYCYEISPSVEEALRQTASGLKKVEIRMKGAFKEAGKKYLREDGAADITADLRGDSGILVDTVRIDEDVKEAITFLKISASGFEQETLEGCERQVEENRPNIAIDLSYGYENLVDIMEWLKEKVPEYRFYMRYYGGNLVPTDYVLYAVADK